MSIPMKGLLLIYHDFRISQDLQLLAVLDMAIFEMSRACFEDGKKTVLAREVNPWDWDDIFIGDSGIGELG